MRHYTATVASEADRLEAAIAARGLDPDTESIWDIWLARGIRPALQALQEGTDVSILPPDNGTLTIGDVDQQLTDKSDRELVELAAEGRLIGFDKRWALLDDDQRLARRAHNEQSRRRMEAQQQAEQHSQQAAAQARRDAENAAHLDQVKTRAAAAFPGTPAEFDAAWPTIKAAYQQQQALAALGVDAVAAKRASGIYEV